MREKDFNNISEDNNEEFEFTNPLEGGCSAEFPEGCILFDDN